MMKTQHPILNTVLCGGLLTAAVIPTVSTADAWGRGTNESLNQGATLLETAMVNEVTAWEHSHGYFDAEQAVVYQGYSDSQLQALSQQGDLLAFKVRHHRMLQSAQVKTDGGRALLLEAAAHGSSYALVDLGYSLLLSIPQARWTLSHVVEALSYFDAAMRRGDYHALGRLKALSAILDDAPGIEWRHFDLDELHARSAAIYALLATERQHLGFAEFEDGRTWLVDRFFAADLMGEGMPSWLLKMVLARFPASQNQLQPPFNPHYSAL